MLRWNRSFWSWKGCRMDTETRCLFRALFRKQLREQGAFLVRSASTGRHRTRAGRLAFGALYGGIVLLVMGSFFSLAWPLGELLLPAGQEALLTLLSKYPGDEDVLMTALRLLDSRPESVAVLAVCLGELGDERALPALKRLAASEETPYLDYIELRSAIEALGGEAPERAFDESDPAYEAMRGMQEKSMEKRSDHEKTNA